MDSQAQLQSPQVAVFVKIAHPAVTRILAAVPSVASLILDGEHGAFHDADFEVLCALIHGFGKEAIVRIPDANPLTIGRALDRGADGVMIPRVQSVAHVRDALTGFVIPPEGTRGWDPTVAAQNYGSGSGILRQHATPRCLVQIETRGALEAAEEIAEVSGVTDLFVGPADLSRALGSRGEVYTDQVRAAMEQLPKRVAGKNVRLGAFVDSPERGKWAFTLGYRYLAVIPDTVLLARAARDATEAIAQLDASATTS